MVTLGEILVLMREAESRHDRNASPDRRLLARLDGRGFHALKRDLVEPTGDTTAARVPVQWRAS